MINNNGIMLASVLLCLHFNLTAANAAEAVPSAAAEKMVQADKQQQESGKVATAVFTTSIVDGKPVDDLKAIGNSVKTVYFFTELKGLDGQTVTHRWSYAGRVMATARIEVDSDPYSAWSSTDLEPNWTGFWDVEVVDADDKVIKVGSFTYNHARNLQMNPDANKAGSEPFREGRGWGRHRW